MDEKIEAGHNVNPSDQLRFVTSLRKDYYQIPYDPARMTSRMRILQRMGSRLSTQVSGCVTGNTKAMPF
jgi:hypothetical protein